MKPSNLSLKARTYLLGVALLAAGAAVAAALLPGDALVPTAGVWPTFFLLTTGATMTQLFVVRTPKNQSYHAGLLFAVAAALLLPPQLLALMILVQHVPDWMKERYPWYIQGFNVCNYTLNALAAWWVAQGILRADVAGAELRWACAGLAACAVFVGLNHLLLATALRLARGHSFRLSGLFSRKSLLVDLALAGLGLSLAVLWSSSPVLTLAVLAPLLAIHVSLPALLAGSAAGRAGAQA